MKILFGIVIVFAVFLLIAQYDACNKKGGVLVRGLVGMECVKR